MKTHSPNRALYVPRGTVPAGEDVASVCLQGLGTDPCSVQGSPWPAAFVRGPQPPADLCSARFQGPCPFFHVGCSRAGLKFTGLSPPPPTAEHDASDVVGGQHTPPDFQSEEQNRFIAHRGLRDLGKLLKQSQIFVKWSKTQRLKVSLSLCPKEYA